MIPAICGLTLVGSSERLSRLTCSSKTSPTSLTQSCLMSREIFKKWVTCLRSACLQRKKQVLLISENDCSSSDTTDHLNWPTPQASQGGVRSLDDRPLTSQPMSARSLPAIEEKWPTPSAAISNDGETIESWEARKQRNLAVGNNGNGMGTPLTIASVRFADNWPTPTANITTGPGTEGRGGGQTYKPQSPSGTQMGNPNGERLQEPQS